MLEVVVGLCWAQVLSKGLQQFCEAPLVLIVEEDVWALVKKHKMTLWGQAVIFCGPDKQFWEDLMYFSTTFWAKHIFKRGGEWQKCCGPAQSL